MHETRSQLSLRKRCRLASLHRSNFYYESQPASDDDLAVMKAIDAVYLQRPFFGSRSITDELRGARWRRRW